MRALVAVVIWLASVSGAAAEPILFSNGIHAGHSTNRCDSGPGVCAGTGVWTIYDDFSLTSPATVTGFSFSDNLFSGTLADYLHTDWSLWASDPLESGSTASFSGTAVSTIFSEGNRDVLLTVTGLNLGLNANTTYWLGTTNLFAKPTTTSRNASTGHNLFGFKQSDGGSNRFDLEGDTFFEIFGTNSAPSPTPEPASLLLFGTGLALAGVQRKVHRRHQSPSASL